MLNALASIANSFGIVIQYISSLITGLLSVFALIPQATGFLTTIYALIPSVLLVFVLAGVAISLVFLLIGR